MPVRSGDFDVDGLTQVGPDQQVSPRIGAGSAQSPGVCLVQLPHFADGAQRQPVALGDQFRAGHLYPRPAPVQQECGSHCDHQRVGQGARPYRKAEPDDGPEREHHDHSGDPPGRRRAEALAVAVHGTTVVGYMYCMTGPSAAPSDEPGRPGEPVASSGLRAAARRLFTRSPAEPDETTGTRDGGSPNGGAPDGGTSDSGTPADSLVAAKAPAVTRPHIPPLLEATAAWSWRLLLTGLLIYLGFRFAVTLRLVVLPFIAAMLLTALLQPLTAAMRRRGIPNLLATWCTFLAAIVVIGGAIFLFADRLSADYSTLSAEVTRTAHQVQHSLSGAPFHLNKARLQH